MTTPTTPRAGLQRPPLAIALRGASWHAPENTIAALELAVDLGADAVTLPVHLSRDQHPVVIEDFALDRTTDGRGPVGTRTVAELKRLDAGGWRGNRFRGQRVQTLVEVLERFRGRLGFWVELKAGSDRYPEIEDRVLSVLEIYDAIDTARIASVDREALERMRAMERGARLVGLVLPGRLDVEAATRAAWEAVGIAGGSPADAAALDRAGLPWVAWGVSEPGEMDRALGLGAFAVATDRPDLLRERIDSSGRPG